LFTNPPPPSEPRGFDQTTPAPVCFPALWVYSMNSAPSAPGCRREGGLLMGIYSRYRQGPSDCLLYCMVSVLWSTRAFHRFEFLAYLMRWGGYSRRLMISLEGDMPSWGRRGHMYHYGWVGHSGNRLPHPHFAAGECGCCIITFQRWAQKAPSHIFTHGNLHHTLRYVLLRISTDPHTGLYSLPELTYA